jgi:hypothetical protein
MAEKRTDPGEDQLRGGTPGGDGARHVRVDPPSGGTNSLSPTGASQPEQEPAAPPGGAPPRSGGTRNDAQTDPEDIFEGTRKRSQSDAKQRARDAADAPTQPRTPHGAGEPRHHQIEPTE